MMSLAMELLSSELRHSRPLYFSSTSWPLTSTCGARPGEKIKSLTCGLDFSMAVTSCAVWIVRCTGGVETGAGAGAEFNCGGSVCVGVLMKYVASFRGPRKGGRVICRIVVSLHSTHRHP